LVFAKYDCVNARFRKNQHFSFASELFEMFKTALATVSDTRGGIGVKSLLHFEIKYIPDRRRDVMTNGCV
jgi:hypothetical protein